MSKVEDGQDVFLRYQQRHLLIAMVTGRTLASVNPYGRIVQRFQLSQRMTVEESRKWSRGTFRTVAPR